MKGEVQLSLSGSSGWHCPDAQPGDSARQSKEWEADEEAIAKHSQVPRGHQGLPLTQEPPIGLMSPPSLQVQISLLFDHGSPSPSPETISQSTGPQANSSIL